MSANDSCAANGTLAWVDARIIKYEQTHWICQRLGITPTASRPRRPRGRPSRRCRPHPGGRQSFLYRWLEQAKVPDGLKAKPHPGSAPRLSLEQQQVKGSSTSA